MLTRVNLLQDWYVEGEYVTREHGVEGYELSAGLKTHFPEPDNAVGWYPIGFERGNDRALEAMGWYGLKLSLHTQTEITDISIKASFADQRSVMASLSLAGSGYHHVDVKLEDFEIEAAKANIWRFLQSFDIQGDAVLTAAHLTRGDKLYVATDVLGKAGDAGEKVSYTMTVYNCTDVLQSVVIKQQFSGWESLYPTMSPAQFVLEPNASREITATVDIHDNMVIGGHESTTLQFIANGDGASAVNIEFKTLRRLEHPYIYHNKEQWAERRALIDQHAKLKPGYEQIIADAEGWVVKPPLPVDERDFCYDTKEEHYIMQAAYAYALTGNIKYAKKVAQFLRYFSDEETGYPRKKKGCSQSYVQEGHFFQHLAIPYDIIHDAGVLTAEDHLKIEHTFRIYIDIFEMHLEQGHISNWILSEMTGAIYCALAIEDIERALRFVFGPLGAIDQLKYGVFNDGWWYECSVSYNTWVSSMYIHIAHALLPFGYNILHTHFPVPFNDEVNSTYRDEEMTVRFGMYNKKWGGNRKSYVRIKDLFDAPLAFLDYRGVIFGMNDSYERKLEGVHFGSTYDLAYTYYQDPEYIPIIEQNDFVDPIFGHAELPEYESQYIKQNAYADNIGIVMLRSQTAGREQSEQIQAVLRYGSHGYAHGHFDRTEMLSIMRYGRSFYNPEHVWWGYGHFMYKFYVQNSMTKNMVVVDEKMQVPSDAKRIMFYNGEAIQASAVKTEAQWSYPPYGGMVYNENETLEDRCKMNASSLPKLDNPPVYGELTDFTEQITQTRVMGVTDDYIIVFDYVKGDQAHQFDSLWQIKGFQSLTAAGGRGLAHVKHTSQFTDDPCSDAQFITDCHWYETDANAGTTVASFATIFGEGEDMRGTRSFYNTSGVLKMDVHTAWPKQATHIIGRAAEDHGIQIPLTYKVEVDGKVKASGEFGAWILGEGHCDVDVSGAQTLKLKVINHPVYNEQGYARKTKQGLFWGEAYIVTGDGTKKNLSDLPLVYNNIDQGHGIGKDYEGGRVTIVGNEYEHAIPTSPVDHEQEGSISIDLTGLDAVRFVGLIGADAFPGDEAQRRMTYAVRSQGEIARYTTIIEPFEGESMIANVTATDANTVTVLLRDGRSQHITVRKIDTEQIELHIVESRDGQIIREERAAGN